MELIGYQKRDAYIVKYLEQMIAKCERNMDKYLCEESRGKRSAYKDVLFKMTNDEQRHTSTEVKGEEI